MSEQEFGSHAGNPVLQAEQQQPGGQPMLGPRLRPEGRPITGAGYLYSRAREGVAVWGVVVLLLGERLIPYRANVSL